MLPMITPFTADWTPQQYTEVYNPDTGALEYVIYGGVNVTVTDVPQTIKQLIGQEPAPSIYSMGAATGCWAQADPNASLSPVRIRFDGVGSSLVVRDPTLGPYASTFPWVLAANQAQLYQAELFCDAGQSCQLTLWFVQGLK